MVVLAALLATALLLLLRPVAAGGLALLALGLALRRGSGLRLLTLAAGIAGVTLVLNAVTEPGPALYRWGPIAVTRAGLVAGGERAGRLVGLVAVGWLAARALGLERLADLAARATWPLERRTPRLAGLGLAVGLAVRFLPEIQHEIARLRLAAAARPAPAASGRQSGGGGGSPDSSPSFSRSSPAPCGGPKRWRELWTPVAMGAAPAAGRKPTPSDGASAGSLWRWSSARRSSCSPTFSLVIEWIELSGIELNEWIELSGSGRFRIGAGALPD